MIALSIAYSFLASAYVLPTFLILWAKWRNKYRAKRGIENKFVEDEEELDEDMQNGEEENESHDEEELENEPTDEEPKKEKVEED
jgi:hypothetical protein